MSELPTRTADLQAIADVATPGPWEVYDANEDSGHGPLWCVANDAFHNPPADDNDPWVAVEVHVGGREDAELIAAMRNDLPKLLAVVEAANEIVSPAYLDAPEPYAQGVRLDAMRDLMAALAALTEGR